MSTTDTAPKAPMNTIETELETALPAFTHDYEGRPYAPIPPRPDNSQMPALGDRLRLRFPTAAEGRGAPAIDIVPKGDIYSGYIIGILLTE